MRGRREASTIERRFQAQTVHLRLRRRRWQRVRREAEHRAEERERVRQLTIH